MLTYKININAKSKAIKPAWPLFKKILRNCISILNNERAIKKTYHLLWVTAQGSLDQAVTTFVRQPFHPSP